MVFLSIPVCLFVSVNLWFFINLQFGNLFDVPIKLLDKHLHAMAQSIDEQLVVVSQVCPSHYDHIVSSVYSAFLAQVYSNCSRYSLLILILDMRTLLTIRSENLLHNSAFSVNGLITFKLASNFMFSFFLCLMQQIIHHIQCTSENYSSSL
jgi:hypothetical protein